MRLIAYIMIIGCLALRFPDNGIAQRPDTPPDSSFTDNGAGQVFRISPDLSYVYSKPGPIDFINNFPRDIKEYTGITFRKRNIVKIGAMAGITAVLVVLDQKITDETQKFGDGIGLNGNNNMKTAFHVFGLPIEVPRDPDTWLYFIGDGWTQTGVTAAFFGYGMISKNNRALTTASQLAEGLLTAGAASQFLKHITGRESPHVATVDGGRWRLFPNQIEYHKHVPHYDAFPSGHLAVAMMTVTVIHENYPTSKLVRPIGYTLMALLSFEMVNNGVHWISDYPLALSMGYVFGKIAASRGRTRINGNDADLSDGIKPSVYPFFSENGLGMRLNFQF